MPESIPSSPPEDSGSPESECRVWLRFPSRRATYCQSAAGADELSWSAHVYEITSASLKLLSHHKFEQGTAVKIGASDDSTNATALILARVAYVIPTSDGKWSMGCAFARELSEEEILAWLKEQG